MIENMEWWQAEPEARPIGHPPPVSRLTHDSRLVTADAAFVAVPGDRVDGHDFIAAAVAAGAAAVVVEAAKEAKWRSFAGAVALVVVPDCRRAMGRLAAAIHGHPSHKLLLVGVTGTDGKTTTSHLTAHVLSSLGLGCGYLSSVGFDTGAGFQANTSHMTTLEAPVIQEDLAEAVARGLSAMVIEASSEGLAQHRLDGCEFDVAVFTNLTRDHLDFHGSMEAYRDAKGGLFAILDEREDKPFAKAAVLNADDAAAPYLRGRTSARLISYAVESPADVRARDIVVDASGLRFTVEVGDVSLPAKTPLFGRFNVFNCLAAIAVASSQGLPPREAVDSLARFPGVPGRMERIDCGQPFGVIVDIASTPAALENVLSALRPATAGRLWVVFGAAGGRDPARRDGMGRVAGRLADRTVVTNEDPRDEDPDAIIEAIAVGLRQTGRAEGRDFVREPDRRSAIKYAFEGAGEGDCVLLAGKATETSMIFGAEAVPWDEREVARQLLGERRPTMDTRGRDLR